MDAVVANVAGADAGEDAGPGGGVEAAIGGGGGGIEADDLGVAGPGAGGCDGGRKAGHGWVE